MFHTLCSMAAEGLSFEIHLGRNTIILFIFCFIFFSSAMYCALCAHYKNFSAHKKGDRHFCLSPIRLFQHFLFPASAPKVFPANIAAEFFAIFDGFIDVQQCHFLVTRKSPVIELITQKFSDRTGFIIHSVFNGAISRSE